MVPVVVAAVLTAVSVQTRSQSLSSSGDSAANAGIIWPEKPDCLTYVRPTPTAMLKHYAFDAFGPYALAITAFTAGFDQAANTPPEWKQGFGGYAERFGSLTSGSPLSGQLLVLGLQQLSEMIRRTTVVNAEGTFPRLGHAVFSDLNGAPYDSGPSGLLIPRVGCPLRRFDGGRLWFVPSR